MCKRICSDWLRNILQDGSPWLRYSVGTRSPLIVRSRYRSMFDQYFDSNEIGRRLRIAREAATLTQVDAAALIGVARTTLIAIEKGQRKVSPDELQRLANGYGTSLNALFSTDSVLVNFVPQFREIRTSSDQELEEYARLFSNLVRAEVELENILGIKHTVHYPPERPIVQGKVQLQAELDAAELRRWLGLGSSPIRDMASLLEIDLGIRLYIRPMKSTISGMFAYDENLGACMLLNRIHSISRHAQTAAHALGHFMCSRSNVMAFRCKRRWTSRKELYADAFGRAFLAPARTVDHRLKEVQLGSGTLTRRHVSLLSRWFGISRHAMVCRLQDLGMAQREMRQWFIDEDEIANLQYQQVPSEFESVTNKLAVDRVNVLAWEAWRRELLSEGQLAQLLSLSRIDLRVLLDDTGTLIGEDDDFPSEPS